MISLLIINLLTVNTPIVSETKDSRSEVLAPKRLFSSTTDYQSDPET